MPYIDRVVSFILGHSTYTDREHMKECVIKHLEYHTCIITDDEKGIVSFCRWNVPKKDTAHILDLIIREDKRGKGILQETVIRGLKLFPDLKYIKYELGYDDGLQNKELKKRDIFSFMYGGVKENKDEDAQM